MPSYLTDGEKTERFLFKSTTTKTEKETKIGMIRFEHFATKLSKMGLIGHGLIRAASTSPAVRS
jgi:hypothetical protein